MFSPFSSKSTLHCSLALGAVLLTASTQVQAASIKEGTSATAMPGGRLAVVSKGFRTAIISATDNDGDSLAAQRALVAANIALQNTRGLVRIPDSEVADALRKMSEKKGTLDLRGPNQSRKTRNAESTYGEPEAGENRLPIDVIDVQNLTKRLKADRLISVFITRGEDAGDRASASAIIEMYDKSGGLVGRGQGNYTATAGELEKTTRAEDDAIREGVPGRASGLPGIDKDNRASLDALRANPPVAEGVARPVSLQEAVQIRALGGAVYRAMAELNRPVELRGAVVAIPSAYQTRVSFGSGKGIRQGARIEYLIAGEPIAYGTVTDVAFGEAIATFAPESAFGDAYVNMEVRNVSNPVASRQGATREKQDEAEFRRFERNFAIALGIAGAAYLIAR